jgi:hypothetical protein
VALLLKGHLTAPAPALTDEGPEERPSEPAPRREGGPRRRGRGRR